MSNSPRTFYLKALSTILCSYVGKIIIKHEAHVLQIWGNASDYHHRLLVRTGPINQGSGFGAPFSLFMRQYFDSQASIVASIPFRRNNSMKIWPKYLEIAETRRTFASTKQS